jgi:hypothetical protein
LGVFNERLNRPQFFACNTPRFGETGSGSRFGSNGNCHYDRIKLTIPHFLWRDFRESVWTHVHGGFPRDFNICVRVER